MSAKEGFPIVITQFWSLINEETIHPHCDI